jgi:hypothetical protein
MADGMVEVVLVIEDPSSRPEQVDADKEDLRSDLVQLGAEVSDRASDEVPAGARSAELLSIGVLTVTVAKPLLGAVVSVINTWLTERGKGSVDLVVGEDRIRIDGGDARHRQRLAETLIARHGSEVADDGSSA